MQVVQFNIKLIFPCTINPTSPHILRILLEPKINCFNDESLLRNIVRQIKLLSVTVAPEKHMYFLLLTLRQYRILFIPMYPGCWGAVDTYRRIRILQKVHTIPYKIKMSLPAERTCPAGACCAVCCVLCCAVCWLCRLCAVGDDVRYYSQSNQSTVLSTEVLSGHSP